MKGKIVGNMLVMVGVAMVLSLTFFASHASASANTYGNHAEIKVVGKDLWGWVVAWVDSKWTFAVSGENGHFIVDGRNTFHMADSGGTWPDGGSWGYTHTASSSTALMFDGDYHLNSPLNSVSGHAYNYVYYNPDGTYTWYRGTAGNTEYVNLDSLPIEVSVDF